MTHQFEATLAGWEEMGSKLGSKANVIAPAELKKRVEDELRLMTSNNS